MSLTLEEHLALSVLRGDLSAAYALADCLLEKKGSPDHKKMEQIRRVSRAEDRYRAVDGYEVYSWPEFRALCDRLAIPWQLPTVRISFTLTEGEFVRVVHEYQGSDGVLMQSVTGGKPA